MGTTVNCPECFSDLKVPPEKIGKKIRCPECQTIVQPLPPKGRQGKPASKPKPPVEEASKPNKTAFVATLVAATLVTAGTIFFLLRNSEPEAEVAAVAPPAVEAQPVGVQVAQEQPAQAVQAPVELVPAIPAPAAQPQAVAAGNVPVPGAQPIAAPGQNGVVAPVAARPTSRTSSGVVVRRSSRRGEVFDPTRVNSSRNFDPKRFTSSSSSDYNRVKADHAMKNLGGGSRSSRMSRPSSRPSMRRR